MHLFIRIKSYNNTVEHLTRFESNLVSARRAGIMRGMLTGIGGGLMWLIIFSSYAVAFWYGVKLIMDDREACARDLANCTVRYDPASLLVVRRPFVQRILFSRRILVFCTSNFEMELHFLLPVLFHEFLAHFLLK